MSAVADVIAGTLQGCTIVALQETGTPADAQNLADRLARGHELSYTPVAVSGPLTLDAEFPLTNSFLVRDDRVQDRGLARVPSLLHA